MWVVGPYAYIVCMRIYAFTYANAHDPKLHAIVSITKLHAIVSIKKRR
jgi:hypothetical protein